MRSATPHGAGLALDEGGPELETHRFAHAAMATLFEVHCVHPDPRYARQAAQAAFELLDRLEQQLSRFVGNSDVSRVNALGAGETARVSPEAMECLAIARRMYDLTHQAFDVSIGTGLERLDLVPEDLAVHARETGVRLDLGGIGKGYAVDRMAESLLEWDVPRSLIHGGYSSVLAADAPPGRDGWPVTLSAPGAGQVLARLCVRRTALSASGTRKGDHILDPRSGRPAPRRAAWAALACRDPAETAAAASARWGPEAVRSPAAVAEALSTAFMLLPVEEIEDLCRQSPGVEGWLILGPTEAGQPAEALVHLAASRPAEDA
jgi:thiamine biosynthesis lipoprotein